MSEIKREDIKVWVAIKATTNNPYGKYWSAFTTIGGMDINGEGQTIEEAYNGLTDVIFNSKYLSQRIQRLPSWRTLILAQ
jgi:hypothetical protein